MDLGVIGLGVMGENLILNIEEKGFSVSVYNRTTQKTDTFITKNKSKKLKGFADLKSFVDSLTSPKKIILLIKSDAIDNLISQIKPFVSKNDILVDAGNSFYEDTKRRTEIYKNDFVYLGIGVSGGEEGARHGPSIMIGGNKEGYLKLKDVFDKIAAKCDGMPCAGYFGEGGAGHFVKMVHNGIEYCEMQLLSEIYFLLRKNFSNQKIANIFKEWLKDSHLNGFLLEICEKIVKRDDNIIDKIVDQASQKGTGMQCVSTALKIGSICTMISDSVFARLISSKKEMRKSITGSLKKEEMDEEIEVDKIKNAFILAKAVAYAQGYQFIKDASSVFQWNINLKEVSLVWRNGCILRGSFLEIMNKMVSEDYFEKSNAFVKMYEEGITDLKWVIKFSADKNVPIPCFSSALNYINGISESKGSGNLIQAMRDFFGSHTLQIEGSEEFIHYNWEN